MWSALESHREYNSDQLIKAYCYTWTKYTLIRMTDPSGGDERLRWDNGDEFTDWKHYLDIHKQTWLKGCKFIKFLIGVLIKGDQELNLYDWVTAF